MDEKLIVRSIRAARRKKKLSLAKLSALAGLSTGYLSKLERSEKAPPISTLSKIALALDLDLASLLREHADPFEDVPLAIVRKGERKIVKTRGSLYGYEYEALAYNKPGKNMEAFIISPGFDERIDFQRDEEEFQHDGEEFMYILEGVHEFRYGGEKYVLRKGDSIYFDSRIPHAGRSLGKRKARILTVMYFYKKISYPIQATERENDAVRGTRNPADLKGSSRRRA
jgi:transcriptional regulator with XRE-family HTH domain